MCRLLSIIRNLGAARRDGAFAHVCFITSFMASRTYAATCHPCLLIANARVAASLACPLKKVTAMVRTPRHLPHLPPESLCQIHQNFATERSAALYNSINTYRKMMYCSLYVQSQSSDMQEGFCSSLPTDIGRVIAHSTAHGSHLLWCAGACRTAAQTTLVPWQYHARGRPGSKACEGTPRAQTVQVRASTCQIPQAGSKFVCCLG